MRDFWESALGTMTDSNNIFAERYRNKSAQELARLAAHADDLIPEAREALLVEIASRPQLSEQGQTAALTEESVLSPVSLDGVRGWLLFYCFGVITACIRSTVVTVVTTINGGIPLVTAVLVLGVVGWNVATVVAIVIRARSALSMVFIQIILSAAATALVFGAQIASLRTSNDSEELGLLILRSILDGAGILIWYRYFCVSERVRITFGRNL
jgi:hypothetical protein